MSVDVCVGGWVHVHSNFFLCALNVFEFSHAVSIFRLYVSLCAASHFIYNYERFLHMHLSSFCSIFTCYDFRYFDRIAYA